MDNVIGYLIKEAMEKKGAGLTRYMRIAKSLAAKAKSGKKPSTGLLQAQGRTFNKLQRSTLRKQPAHTNLDVLRPPGVKGNWNISHKKTIPRHLVNASDGAISNIPSQYHRSLTWSQGIDPGYTNWAI